MTTAEKKVDRRVSRTKSNIRKALLELLEEKNMHDITISELSERADINRKTFYSHYTDIQAIFNEIESELEAKLLSILKNPSLFDDGFDAYMLFYKLNEAISDDIDMYSRLLKAASKGSVLLHVKECIRYTITDFYRSNSDKLSLDFEMYSEYISSGLAAMYIKWFFMEERPPISEMARLAGDIVFGGLKSFPKSKS